jgi:hypothetical protein
MPPANAPVSRALQILPCTSIEKTEESVCLTLVFPILEPVETADLGTAS